MKKVWRKDNETSKLLDRFAKYLNLDPTKRGYKKELSEALGLKSHTILHNWVNKNKARIPILMDAIKKYGLPMDLIMRDPEEHKSNGGPRYLQEGEVAVSSAILDLVPSSRRLIERMNFFAEHGDTELVFDLFKALCADVEKASPSFFRPTRPKTKLIQNSCRAGLE